MIGLVLTILAIQQGPFWEKMGEANNVASLCAVRAGVRLDDDRTSPDVLARGAMAACFQELNALDDAVNANAVNEMSNVSLRQREQAVSPILSKTRKRIEDLTIQAILEQRAKK